jgi:hypothetical protein
MICENEPLLGLWQKQIRLERVKSSFSAERKKEQERARHICHAIIHILSKHQAYDTKQIWEHKSLQKMVKKYSYLLFRRKLVMLQEKAIIREVLKPNKTSYRPKKWSIQAGSDPGNLIREFDEKYNLRSHQQSYSRKSITAEEAKHVITKLKNQGIEKPSAGLVAKELKCSKKQLYQRKDLRRLFIYD